MLGSIACNAGMTDAAPLTISSGAQRSALGPAENESISGVGSTLPTLRTAPPGAPKSRITLIGTIESTSAGAGCKKQHARPIASSSAARKHAMRTYLVHLSPGMTVHDVAGFEPVRDNVEMTLSESQKDSLYPLYGAEGLQGPCGAVARSQIVRRAWTALYERRVAGRPTSARACRRC